jgi:hypothetical protein
VPSLRRRLAELDWPALHASLDAQGYARTPPLLSAGECAALCALFDDARRFRKRIDMGSHHYGQGEYRYFAYPLPRLVAALRRELYPHLVPIANTWAERLGRAQRYPETLAAFLDTCHRHGQTRATPLLLRYARDGYNRLHQDRYGPVAFPLQVVSCLSRPGIDFAGGEFLLLESRPRTQSRGEAIALARGELLIFASLERPIAGRRGAVAAQMRHGLSTLRRGARTALGIIFHDA